MSNARNNPRNQGGNPPQKARPQQAAAAAPMGAFQAAKRSQDDLRSKLRKFTETYKSLCDSNPPDSKRFRVRAEILPNGEDYITIEMGCNVPGLINMSWSERSSSDIEIRYGSQLERYRNVLTMVRRSNDRLGYPIDIRGALELQGTPEESRLLMSNKDFNKLPRAQRDPRDGGVPLATPRAPVFTRGPPGNYYQAQAAEAAARMQQEAASRRSWSDQMDEEASSVPTVTGRPPISSQRGDRQGNSGNDLRSASVSQSSSHDEADEGRAPSRSGGAPAPTTGVVRKAPTPSSYSGAGGRKAPAPSTVG